MSARKPLIAILALLLIALIAPAAAQAEFGIKTLTAETVNKDGSVDLRAGSHPYEFRLGVEMNQDSEGNPEGTLREIIVDLPAGMVGDPLAVPRCSGALFEGVLPKCPGNTQIGVAHVNVVGIEETVVVPVYNLTPPMGVLASIGFSVINENSFQEASLRTSDYGVSASDITLPTDKMIRSFSETIWGVPADASHDPQRSCFLPSGQGIEGCASDSTPLPFLSLPTSCGAPLVTTATVASVQEPDVPRSVSVESLGEAGTPEGIKGCDRPPFDPRIAVQPETTTADSPSGLHVGIQLPQNLEPKGVATAHLRKAVVTLPKGMALNPSSADGLGACSLAQIGLKAAGPGQCPLASKVATVQAESPALDHPVPGSVYIAKQGENPFGSLLALYLVLDDPITGVVVKLAGKVEPDPLTGQLRTSFDDNPQLPFENFDFDFFGGPRATLTTPPTCGTYTTETEMTPWSAPEGAKAFPSSSLQITSAPGGGPCAPSEAQMPNSPSFRAGTTTPLAGAYSPFVLKLSRENGSQRLAGLNFTLPPGLSAKLAGLSECSEAQIALAQARREPGEGALEKASPSCPASSRLGAVNVGAGSGTPLYTQGNAYLAGPYKGAPLSTAIIVPAVAGPFDLGTVVVRAALYVDESTAQVRVISDPFPTILRGIPLDVRSVAVQIDRDQFTLNPTSCQPKEITAQALSLSGASAALSSRFQVAACGGLAFKPKLALSLKGATKRTGHPALRAVLTYPKGSYANIASAQVTLPHSEFLDTTHIGTVCTRVQFAARTCPKGSVYGSARAFTPLLDKPLEGPVYLRSSNHKLPDLVAALRGQVDFNLVGRVDTGKANGIRNTFEAAPDVPVAKFVLSMKGGKKGLLVNSEDICSKPQHAIAHFAAHNGKVLDIKPLIANGCN